MNLRGGEVKASLAQIDRGSSLVGVLGDSDIHHLCHTQLSGNHIRPQGPSLLLPSSPLLTADHGE